MTGFLKDVAHRGCSKPAEVDCAGQWRTLHRSIALPAGRTIGGVRLPSFPFVMHWNDLLYPLLFIG